MNPPVGVPASAGASRSLASLLLVASLVAGCAPSTPAPPAAPVPANNNAVPQTATTTGDPSAILAALDRRVSVAFHDAPLADVVAEIAAQAGVAVSYDRQALADMGLDPNRCLVTLQVSDVKAASALNLATRQVDVDFTSESRFGVNWLPRSHDVQITSQAVAGQHLTAACYPVADIVDRWNRSHSEADLAEALARLIDAESWDEYGGEGHVRAMPGALVVVQTQPNHARIVRLLAGLRTVADSPSGPVWTDIDQSSPPVRAILAALRQPVELDLDDPSLAQFLNAVATRHDFNLVIDRRAVIEAYADLNDPVIGTFPGAPLSEALDTALQESDLMAVIADEALWITSWERLWQDQEIRLYPTAGLTMDRDDLDTDELIDLLTGHVWADRWDEVGGPGSVMALPGCLGVLQGHRQHLAVEAFLDVVRGTLDPLRIPTPFDGLPSDDPLGRIISVDWFQTPLNECLADLAAQIGCDMLLLDDYLLELHDADLKAPITLRLTGVSARSVLDLLLGSYSPRYHVKDRRLRISTDDAWYDLAITRAYRWHELPRFAAQYPRHAWIDLIETHVSPADWDNVGGPAMIDTFPAGLLVTHSQDGHRDLERFLTGLRRLEQAQQGDPIDDALSPRAARLLAALDEPASISADAQPLDELLEELSRKHGFAGQVLFDAWNNPEPSVPSDSPVTLRVEGVSLRSALALALNQFALQAVIDDDLLLILPAEDEYLHDETRFYPLAGATADELQALADCLTGSFGRSRWSDTDESGRNNVVPGGLVISQTPVLHDHVRHLWHQLQPLLTGSPVPPPHDERIRAALEQPVEVELAGMPLEDALVDLGMAHDVPIRLRVDLADAIRESIIPPDVDTPADRTLADVLNALVFETVTGWVVQDDMLTIDLGQDAAWSYTAQVYDTRPLLGPGRLSEVDLLTLIDAGPASETPSITPSPNDAPPGGSSAASPWRDTIDIRDQFLLRGALVTVANEHGHRHLRAVLREALSHGNHPPTSEEAAP
jgi:hypothetical protein